MVKKVLFPLLFATATFAQQEDKFKQLYEEFATPNSYRNAAGAPGHEYYQQQADYIIKVTLDDAKQQISGEETVTYTNNSPDALTYLWLQLDQNQSKPDSEGNLSETSTIEGISNPWGFKGMIRSDRFPGGFNITELSDITGKPLKYLIVGTMMRINLDQPLIKGGKFSFKVRWWYQINNRMQIGGRSGYEYFKEEDNYLYTIAQFFPRMCVYNDVEGWQNKAFLGRGEFTLPFGNYDVMITVPEDHTVGSTGVLQNPTKVLSKNQQDRWKQAIVADAPVMIVTPDEAREAEQTKKSGTKTWQFKATNVRDFAFATSRKFIWDAMRVRQTSGDVMAMSYYPKEGMPLWDKYSTLLVAQTLKTYSKFTFDYPYPVAISVHAASIGMEYPMICFNGGRPSADGTYDEGTKYGMMSVIIHEVGHNYFPMIINSDERQWTWMDEGLNTFLQYLAEQEWQRNYPSSRGPAHLIVDYMKGDKTSQSPVMTNSESLKQFGNNAYGKPATALNILRETILGRENFDYAFKVYAQRWMFKHPTPEDFFRTMEDASGVDLDWFWRGWFYTTDHVDFSLENVQWFRMNTRDPDTEAEFNRLMEEMNYRNISEIRNESTIEQTENEKNPALNDKFILEDPYKVTDEQRTDYSEFLRALSNEDQEFIDLDYHFYQLDFRNKGGLVMPLLIEFLFDDSTTKMVKIPAEIWKMNHETVSKVFYFEKQVISVALDPYLETADCEMYDNNWPRKFIPSRFDVFREQMDSGGGGRRRRG